MTRTKKLEQKGEQIKWYSTKLNFTLIYANISISASHPSSCYFCLFLFWLKHKYLQDVSNELRIFEIFVSSVQTLW